MSQETTKEAEDIEWLLERFPEANEDQQYNFAERVSIMVIDGGVEEARARLLAFNRLGFK